jgi:tRNA threonylcarbamoyladenosine biosynthesis protein TsaB
VGVARDDVVLSERVEVTTRSHGGVLPRLVQEALAEASLGWEAIDGLAVSIGPGSFTGLRIGLSLAKGIAYAGRLPIAPVSTLEALAWAADASAGDTVWAVLDARMKEVYAASFTRTASGLVRRLGSEHVFVFEETGAILP